MAGEEAPIAWTALDGGTPVLASDGAEIGKVSAVVADEQKDIFSGIVFRAGWLDDDRFAPADAVDVITAQAVRLTLSSAQAEDLGSYEG